MTVMLKIDPSKSEKEIILNLVNTLNQTHFTTHELSFSNPTAVNGANPVTLDDLSGITDYNELNDPSYIDQDTKIEITASPTSNYSGSKSFWYRRINLEVQYSIFHGNDFHINENLPNSGGELKDIVYPFLSKKINYLKNSFDYTKADRPDGGVQVTLTPKSNSLCYNHGLELVFNKAPVKFDPDIQLDGLDWGEQIQFYENDLKATDYGLGLNVNNNTDTFIPRTIAPTMLNEWTEYNNENSVGQYAQKQRRNQELPPKVGPDVARNHIVEWASRKISRTLQPSDIVSIQYNNNTNAFHVALSDMVIGYRAMPWSMGYPDNPFYFLKEDGGVRDPSYPSEIYEQDWLKWYPYYFGLPEDKPFTLLESSILNHKETKTAYPEKYSRLEYQLAMVGIDPVQFDITIEDDTGENDLTGDIMENGYRPDYNLILRTNDKNVYYRPEGTFNYKVVSFIEEFFNPYLNGYAAPMRLVRRSTGMNDYDSEIRTMALETTLDPTEIDTTSRVYSSGGSGDIEKTNLAGLIRDWAATWANYASMSFSPNWSPDVTNPATGQVSPHYPWLHNKPFAEFLERALTPSDFNIAHVDFDPDYSDIDMSEVYGVRFSTINGNYRYECRHPNERHITKSLLNIGRDQRWAWKKVNLKIEANNETIKRSTNFRNNTCPMYIQVPNLEWAFAQAIMTRPTSDQFTLNEELGDQWRTYQVTLADTSLSEPAHAVDNLYGTRADYQGDYPSQPDISINKYKFEANNENVKKFVAAMLGIKQELINVTRIGSGNQGGYVVFDVNLTRVIPTIGGSTERTLTINFKEDGYTPPVDIGTLVWDEYE